MKKYRFALLALIVSAATFAFTNPPPNANFATVHAFSASGTYLGSGEYEVLDEEICPGEEIFCAQVWTAKTANNQPAGTRLEDMEKASAR